MTVMYSLAASCAFRALSYSIEGKPKEEREKIIESILGAWRGFWRSKFQEDMAMYNELLTDGRVKGAVDKLTQPEEFQIRFDWTMKEAEKSARAALYPEKAK